MTSIFKSIGAGVIKPVAPLLRGGLQNKYNTSVVLIRIVGYDSPNRVDIIEFEHLVQSNFNFPHSNIFMAPPFLRPRIYHIPLVHFKFKRGKRASNMPNEASSSRASHTPAKAPSVPPTGMRSPAKIRTPTKLVRPRETHWAARSKVVKKRLLEAADGPHSSALPPLKRVKLSDSQPTNAPETGAPIGGASGAVDAVEATPEPKEDEGYAGYAEGVQRRVEVGHCLEEHLLRDNARMRLKALNLRQEVDFYYGLLARIELVAQQMSEKEGRSNQQQEKVTPLALRLQRIISASKPSAAVETSGRTVGDAAVKPK
ncbi:unnamed protein product [Phytophthora fragariaefolia]|uniref:Unnamed protein product n=1 Tax=Phytophthora fragariaefolia TaxID=1490495 RepID=A0A9W6X614_9STRA|nr:unnamed protein product [Phytophthora fragariaefolia]